MRGFRGWVVAAALAAALLTLWWALRPRTATVTIYFLRADQNATTLAPVSRTASGRGSNGLVAAALRALLEGPSIAERERGLTSAIPQGTRLWGVQIRDGVVRADFSREVEAGGGSVSMLSRFWQIVYTATPFSEAPRVRILIDGRERAAMGGEGVLIDRPIARPPTIPRF